MTRNSNTSDIGLFLGEMLRRPAEVVAIAPSSALYARKMTEGVEEAKGPIVEIGPGTGSFTRAILDRGIAPERLTLLEMNPRFCETLRAKFPGVTVLNRTAQEIEDIGLSGIGAVISGVPVLARPTIQREVVGRAFRVMRPDGFFNQLTYSPKSPISPDMLMELGLSAEKRATVWANLPPGRVFVFRRIHH
ncbi:rRNA adenine N-6-methyltransferase family protein [Phaeobacter sp. J2-8]|uniref:class I SAM-dependent methyltransferase n=1 Tax=Phaeobacter sp. J2-8 TaxID=2931394 RepID=UPI001FD4ADF3|nr:rRNA adenine N-6-methyltransferase family protein [Phaeobacter sp. J2-8]MCJ7872261.1 methyltransferase type 12 [Phaeobacter sp. J2-8]